MSNFKLSQIQLQQVKKWWELMLTFFNRHSIDFFPSLVKTTDFLYLGSSRKAIYSPVLCWSSEQWFQNLLRFSSPVAAATGIIRQCDFWLVLIKTDGDWQEGQPESMRGTATLWLVVKYEGRLRLVGQCVILPNRTAFTTSEGNVLPILSGEGERLILIAFGG